MPPPILAPPPPPPPPPLAHTHTHAPPSTSLRQSERFFPLLALPNELLLHIIRLLLTDVANPAPALSALLRLSATCHFLHLLSSADNHLLWKAAAVAIGIPAQLALEDVLYPGVAAIEDRSWYVVVKLNYLWKTAWPAASAPGKKLIVPKLRTAASRLPTSLEAEKRERETGKRVIELAVDGPGKVDGDTFSAQHVMAGDDGNAIFSIMDQHGRASTVVIDPLRETYITIPFPAGASVETQSFRSFVIDYAAATFWSLGSASTYNRFWRYWKVPSRLWGPDRFAVHGDKLVGLFLDKPAGQRVLYCVQTLPKIGTTVLWEYDHIEEWKEGSASTAHSMIANIKITSLHAIILTYRHPARKPDKVYRPELVILDINTGAKVTVLPLPQAHGFTSALDLNMLVTDSFIVTGGERCVLHVWKYVGEDAGLIYTLPSPSKTLRSIHAITLSACGRYLAAVLSDQLHVYDMNSGCIKALYSNNRKVDKENIFAANPNDSFPGGIWCWWRDYRNVKTIGDRRGWTVDDEEGGVCYLTPGAKKEIPMLKAAWVWVAQRPFEIALYLRWALVTAWVYAMGMRGLALIVAAVAAAWMVWGREN